MSRYNLLRYIGGKTRAIKHLKKYVPENTKEVCSPFFGGGSFEIFLSRQNIKIHGYDNFRELVCFWKAVNKDKEKLYNFVKKYYPLKKEKFYELQKQIVNNNDLFQIASKFYVLNRCSFSGTTLSGGMSKNHPRFTKNSIEKVKNFEFNINVAQESFEKSIIKHDCLVYADPPYMIKDNLYGVKGNQHDEFDHLKLSEILNKRNNFILCYNNKEEIKELYNSHQFFYPKWKYGSGKNKDSNEILIISKDINVES